MKPASHLLLTLAFCCSTASAAVVNFDLNLRLDNDDHSNVVPDTYVGLGAAPDAAGNTHWNSVRRTSSGNVSSAAAINSGGSGGGPIRDSSGMATSVDILLGSTTTANGETTMGQQRSVGQQELGNSSAYEDLMGDFLQLDAPGVDVANRVGTIAGTINGLIAGNVYNIYFYGQHTTYGASPLGDSTSGANSFFAITGTLNGSILGNGEQTGWDGANGGNGTFTEGDEYVKLTATANATGEIFFIWQNVVAGVNVATDAATDGGGLSSDLASLNGIQIESVPEPSAALLGGLGILGLIIRRRR